MTYHMSFKGSYRFADAHCLEAGLDAFVAYDNPDEGTGVELDDLKIDGLLVTVFFDNNAPASMSYGTQSALGLLAQHAKSGTVRSKFEGDSTETIRAGQRRTAAGLPPRHHRWEVYFAARAGSADELVRLQKAGVAIAAQFHSGSSLHLAAQSGSAAAVRVLLDAGAAVDGRTSADHPTPLMAASSRAAAEVLLAAGADREALARGRRPIELVCDNRAFEVAALLLEVGATLPSDEEALVSMLSSIVSGGALPLVMAIVARAPAVAKTLADPELMTAAVRRGDPVLVDYLLQQGAVLPETYLVDAVRAGAVELVRGALQGPEGCGDSSHGGDPMCLAAADGQVEIMKLLREHGVPIAPVVGDTSPLHRAAAGYKKQAVLATRWLLDQGVPVDALNIEGTTALGYAAGMVEGSSIALLVERGANPALVADRDAAAFIKKTLRQKKKKTE